MANTIEMFLAVLIYCLLANPSHSHKEINPFKKWLFSFGNYAPTPAILEGFLMGILFFGENIHC